MFTTYFVNIFTLKYREGFTIFSAAPASLFKYIFSIEALRKCQLRFPIMCLHRFFSFFFKVLAPNTRIKKYFCFISNVTKSSLLLVFSTYYKLKKIIAGFNYCKCFRMDLNAKSIISILGKSKMNNKYQITKW